MISYEGIHAHAGVSAWSDLHSGLNSHRAQHRCLSERLATIQQLELARAGSIGSAASTTAMEVCKHLHH